MGVGKALIGGCFGRGGTFYFFAGPDFWLGLLLEVLQLYAVDEFPSFHILLERQYLFAQHLGDSPFHDDQVLGNSSYWERYSGSWLLARDSLTLIRSSCLGMTAFSWKDSVCF